MEIEKILEKYENLRVLGNRMPVDDEPDMTAKAAFFTVVDLLEDLHITLAKIEAKL